MSSSTGDERVARRVGYLIDDDDLRPPQLREAGQKILDRAFRRRRREHHRRLRIAKRRFQTFGVARQFGGEQRNRDAAHLDRRVETGNVLDALWREDGNPVTGTRELLHPGTDGLQPDTEFGPGHLLGLSFGAGVVQVAIRHEVADIRDVAFDEGYQRRAWRHLDVAVGVQAVLDL